MHQLFIQVVTETRNHFFGETHTCLGVEIPHRVYASGLQRLRLLRIIRHGIGRARIRIALLNPPGYTEVLLEFRHRKQGDSYLTGLDPGSELIVRGVREDDISARGCMLPNHIRIRIDTD